MPSLHRRHRSAWPHVVLAASMAAAVVSSVGVSRADTTSQLQSARAKLTALTAQLRSASQQQATIESQVGAILGRIDAERRSLEATQAQIADDQRRIDRLAELIRTERAALDQRAAQAYTQGPASGLEAILGAGSLADLSDRLEFLNAASRNDADLVASLTTNQN